MTQGFSVLLFRQEADLEIVGEREGYFSCISSLGHETTAAGCRKR